MEPFSIMKIKFKIQFCNLDDLGLSTLTYSNTSHVSFNFNLSFVHNAFRKKDGSVRYTHIKLTRAKGYFAHDINGGGDNMFTADSICETIEF